MERIYHTWDKWECFPAGFYGKRPPGGMTTTEAEEFYRDFLIDLSLFESALKRVISEWRCSCEHYLTNPNMNRIAWLGQASVCIHNGIPACFRGGYNLLTEEQKGAADAMALKYMNVWFKRNGHPTLAMEDVQSKTEANIY
jgi:hypothetical protein